MTKKKKKKENLDELVVKEVREIKDSPEKGGDQNIDESLAAIYSDESGAMPDLTKIQPAKSRWWFFAVVAFLIFIVGSIIAAGVLFSVLKPFRGFSGDALRIQIEGPEEVAVGKETTYLINYQNLISEPLARTELRITFPNDFVIREMDPEPTKGNETWRIGSLYEDDHGTISIKGIFTGALGTETAVQVVGIYRPASFNSDFETLFTKILRYTESVLDGELNVPGKVLPGDEVSFEYTIRNSGEDDIEDLVTRINLPEGFEEDGSPTGTVSNRVFEINVGNLGAGSSTVVVLNGAFAASVSGEVTILAETGRLDEEGKLLPAERSEATFTVLSGDLLLKLVVNGQDSELRVPYDGLLRFAARYENTSSEDLKDVKLRLILEPLDENCSGECTVNWDTYEDNASGTPSGAEVVWGEDEIEGLSRLLPREDGGIDISVDGLGVADGRSGLAFRVVLEAEVGMLGDTPIDRVVRSSPVIVRYTTDAALSSVGRYFLEEGAPIGIGPLPPVVGKETTYRVEWVISKSFHELEDITVSAPFSKIASWASNTIIEAGELGYDATTREVTWKLNRMPEDVDEVRVGFDVVITPGEADENRFAKILGETVFEGKDKTTDHKLIQTRPEITTDLREDEYADGKGVVRASES